MCHHCGPDNKNKNVKGSKESEEKKKLSKDDFLLKPLTPSTKNVASEFVFSDYENDNEDEISLESDASDDSDDNFEDSKDALSDSDQSPTTSPKKSKSTFLKTTQAQRQPSSNPKNPKRSALSPAEVKNLKKSRPQS